MFDKTLYQRIKIIKFMQNTIKYIHTKLFMKIQYEKVLYKIQ